MLLELNIWIVNRVIEELRKPRKDQDWTENSLKALHKKAMRELFRK